MGGGNSSVLDRKPPEDVVNGGGRSLAIVGYQPVESGSGVLFGLQRPRHCHRRDCAGSGSGSDP